MLVGYRQIFIAAPCSSRRAYSFVPVNDSVFSEYALISLVFSFYICRVRCPWSRLWLSAVTVHRIHDDSSSNTDTRCQPTWLGVFWHNYFHSIVSWSSSKSTSKKKQTNQRTDSRPQPERNTGTHILSWLSTLTLLLSARNWERVSSASGRNVKQQTTARANNSTTALMIVAEASGGCTRSGGGGSSSSSRRTGSSGWHTTRCSSPSGEFLQQHRQRLR